MRLFLRLFLIPLGYACGLTAATLVLVLGAWLPSLREARGAEEQAITLLGLMVEGGGAFFIIGGLAFLPSLVAIVIAEAFSIRSLFYYAAAGFLLAIAPMGLAGTGGSDLYSPEALAGAGFAGGIVYWFVAGQGAGPSSAPVEDAAG